MPAGLEIDHKRPIHGSMAAYAEQVLICTGKDDWPSRIEEDNSGDNLAADLKELLGRGGIYSDVLSQIQLYRNHLLFPSVLIMLGSPFTMFQLRTRRFRLPSLLEEKS